MREAKEVITPDKLKDVLITRTAIKCLKSEDWVEKVVNFQFKGARDAFKRFAQVEVSGFGTYFISQRKLRSRRAKYYEAQVLLEKAMQREDLPIWRQKQLEARLSKLNEDLEYLQTKEKLEI